MSRVLTFSRVFPIYHPRKGEPTYFVEKIWQSLGDCFYDQVSKQLSEVVNFDTMPLSTESFEPKHHTIRAGHRWKVGDKFSPRVWSGKPYSSKQIIIAPDIEVKKVWDFNIRESNNLLQFEFQNIHNVATNDGLELVDFLQWFNKPFDGQIICWNENIEY